MFEAALDEKRPKALSSRRADRRASALHPVDFEIVASAVACEMPKVTPSLPSGTSSAPDRRALVPSSCSTSPRSTASRRGALVTPTPDVVTMTYLFIPMFTLYMLGILFCHLFPGFDPNEIDEPEPAEEVAV